MKKLFAIVGIIWATNSFAQYPRVDIPGSEVRKIASSIVSGQEYELQILLPGSYHRSTKKYSVVYLMDSQWDFPLVKSLYGQHYYDGFIPELIIVGVTWSGPNANADSLRVRDYTPTNDGRYKQGGGADKFLSFMKTELFPFIESSYRADNNNRTLMGCSLGGLVTLYAMFTQPDLFSGYASASPAIGWDREVISKYEKEFATKKLNHPVRLYMSLGDVERSRPAYERFAATMAERKYQGVSMVSKVLENTGHSGTKSETFGRGLQFIFERPKLNLQASQLDKYASLYKAGNNNSIEIKVEDNGLTLYFSPTNKFRLYASSETEFYSTSELLTIRFKNNGTNVEGFQLERYGSSQYAEKVK